MNAAVVTSSTMVILGIVAAGMLAVAAATVNFDGMTAGKPPLAGPRLRRGRAKRTGRSYKTPPLRASRTC